MDFFNLLIVLLMTGLDVFLIAFGFQDMRKGRTSFDRVLGAVMLFVGSISVLVLTYQMQLNWITR